ncbi:chaperonin 10-like protein [Lyophyllum atratum]|nr:chaperonin 10-like protein [Lyophyllum atratum]
MALSLESKPGGFVVPDRHISEPEPGELLIQKYGFYVAKYPAVLGADAAGEVEEVGEGVSTFSFGDRVFFAAMIRGDGGAFQQYAIIPAPTFTMKIPPQLSFEEASTIPVAITAAYLGLCNSKAHGFGLAWPLESTGRGGYAGTPSFILGGASSVGQYVIQFAKLSDGFSQTRRLLEVPLGDPHPRRYDAISTKETQQTGHDVLGRGGNFVTVSYLAITKAEDIGHSHLVGFHTLPQNRVVLEGLYGKIPQLLDECLIVPNRFEVLPDGLQGLNRRWSAAAAISQVEFERIDRGENDWNLNEIIYFRLSCVGTWTVVLSM